MAKGQQDGITILLGIKGYEVGKVRERDEDFVVEIESLPKREPCPCCGCTYVYSNGKGKIRKVLHSWSRGKNVYLELGRKRWRCRGCGHCFNNGAELLLSYSRITRQAEAEALWQLKDRGFSQVEREPGVGYGILHRLLEMEMEMEMEIDEEALGFIGGEEEIFLGIDEHSFSHQELVYTVTEVKKRRLLGVFRDDRIATLKDFLSKYPQRQGHRGTHCYEGELTEGSRGGIHRS